MTTAPERHESPAPGRPGGSARVAVASASGVAAVGGMLFGYDTGVISGAVLFIRTEFGIGDFMEQLIVSGLLLGALVGAWQAGGAFALYAGVSVISLGFLIARAPETKGRSLAQIEESLRSRGSRERSDSTPV